MSVVKTYMWMIMQLVPSPVNTYVLFLAQIFIYYIRESCYVLNSPVSIKLSLSWPDLKSGAPGRSRKDTITPSVIIVPKMAEAIIMLNI